jgi:hypothetical protein
LFLIVPLGLQAQQRDTLRRDTIPQDSIRHISPGTAFYRSVLVPGWGQFSVGATRRGAVFVALQAASYFMLGKTLIKLNDANDQEDTQINIARDSITALMLRDTAAERKYSFPDSLQAAIDTTRGVVRARGLIDSRKQQRQDWITYTLVLTLASGVDAFVAAHLADFPATIDAEPRIGGGMELKLTVPFPRKRE